MALPRRRAQSPSSIDSPTPLPTWLAGVGGSSLRDLGLYDSVAESRRLLDLQNDWDGDGSPAYADATWTRAVAFLVRFARRVQETGGVSIETVDVMPGSHGNIDVELVAGDRRILVSVPSDPVEPARFYAHDRREFRTVKGTLDAAAENGWLIMWLGE